MAGLKIKRGDRVRVLTGKDRGTEGLVVRVLPTRRQGRRRGREHGPAPPQGPLGDRSGGILDIDMPIPAANVAVLSPGDGKPTRVGYKLQADGTKVRVCRRTGAEL